MQIIVLLIGLSAGILSGLIGIGGGVIMIPLLTLFLGYNQHLSQGTTLAAMIPPIGLLAALEYYRSGYVNIPVALLMAAGFIAGGFFGAKIAVYLNDAVLKKIFGIVMMLLAVKMIFFD